MLKIRLRRVGAKKQASYRIIIAESTAPRDGKSVETIGFYNPRTDPETVQVQEERALHWLSMGAQPTESVARILRTHGTMGRFERLRGGESLNVVLGEVAVPATTPAPVKAAPEAVEVVEEPQPEEVVVAASEDTEESETA